MTDKKPPRWSAEWVGTRQGDKWVNYDQLRWASLWFRFLAISPSYELARKCRAGELTGAEVLPADFDAVLAVYDDLGDVQVMHFQHWWKDGALRHFGYSGDKPSVTRIGVARGGADPEQWTALGDSLGAYAGENWLQQGERTTLVAAIPVGLPKAQIMKQLAALLDELPEVERKLIPQEPRYKLTGKKLDRQSIEKYLRALETKRKTPDAKLWEIGVKGKLSGTYSDQEARSQQRTYDQAGDRKNLKELTSRALLRGHMIAENAARGLFPIYAKCEHAMPLDWPFLHEQERALNEKFWRRTNRAV